MCLFNQRQIELEKKPLVALVVQAVKVQWNEYCACYYVFFVAFIIIVRVDCVRRHHLSPLSYLAVI